MSRGDIIPQRGAIAEDLGLEVLRELTLADMARLAAAPKQGTPVLQKLRSIHHAQARMIAEGKKLIEIAAAVGCTTQRLVQLQNDPTFAELVVVYRDQILTASVDQQQRFQAKILDAGEQAIDEIVDRLENDEIRNRMPIGEVRKIAEFAMDRTIAPPKQAINAPPPPQRVTINFGTPLKDRPLLDGNAVEIDINASDAAANKISPRTITLDEILGDEKDGK